MADSDDQRRSSSSRQKRHYEKIHEDYSRHYFDAWSMAYRERFFYDEMFAGLDLDDCDVADLASGNGYNSVALLKRYPKARPVGLDISAAACSDYAVNVGSRALECDLTKPLDLGQTFDAAMMIGGLHHCVADLEGALNNIAKLVRPGGHFLLVEANRDFFLEGARRIWYRLDRYFDAPTEQALDHDELCDMVAGRFVPVRVRWMGGPGYFLVYNSLMFRLPSKVKELIAPPLMAVDALYNKVPGRFAFPYFAACWRRV